MDNSEVVLGTRPLLPSQSPPTISIHTAKTTRSVFEQVVKRINDVLQDEGGYTTVLNYIEQISWLLVPNDSDPLENYPADAHRIGILGWKLGLNV